MTKLALKLLVAISILSACSSPSPASTPPAPTVVETPTSAARLLAPTRPVISTVPPTPVLNASPAPQVISPLISVIVPTVQPPSVPTGAAVVNGATESAPTTAGECLKPFDIKAIDNTYLYYLSTHSGYARARPDRCFATEPAATTAGFKKAPGK